MQSKKFRADINGLRAIAVLSVMFFHFNQGLIPGGFAGVDVFFVISGFLMTSIIFRGLENNNFSLWNFLKARARRIVPALVTVISIVLALGYLFFEPLTYQLAGKHGFSSLLFISNITYANEAGYFDADSFSKLFLHTWSLSVEWQFYIVYPIILIILSKLFSINTLKKIVLIAAIISFAFCIYFSSINKTLSYFMIYTRGWEMLFGGVAFLFPLSTTENKKRIIEVLGLILIITSFFIFSDTDNWPSYNALLPVFGAYLCILSNCKKTLLSNVAFQKIGLWSYSIYLIHWPFIVFFKKINIEISIVSYFIFTLLFAFIVYSFIERKRNYYIGLLLTYFLSLFLSYFISIDGFKYRVPEKFKLTGKEYHNKYYGGSGTSHGGIIQYVNMTEGEEPLFIITGDSFARQYMNYIKSNHIKSIAILKDGCFSTKNYLSRINEQSDITCSNRYRNLIKTMNKYNNTPVVIIHSWDNYKANLSKSNEIDSKPEKYDYNDILKQELRALIKDGGFNRKYYIIGSNIKTNGNYAYECLAKISLDNPAINIYKSYFSCENNLTINESIYNQTLEKIAEEYDNVTYINPNEYICNNGICQVIINNNPLLSDGNHLSIYGANIIGKNIFSKIHNDGR